MRNCRFLYGTLLSLLLPAAAALGQVSANPYVPCQEMPDLLQNYNADLQAITRFYTSSFFGSLYQLAYLTGGRQFYALKKELVDSKKMTYKQFHDSILHLNAMPVEMIRATLEKQPLDKDFTTKWRFYDHMTP